MKKLKNFKAFTLAETLLTLAIIGVIAVMTIPTLKDHSDEVKYVAAVKKAFSSVASATTAIEVRHTDSNFWNFSSAKTVEWYKEVVNSIPNPDPSAETWDIITLDGNSAGTFSPSLWTADGMAWQITTYPTCSTKGGVILVDTNGAQQPNTVGIDVHGFVVGHKSCKASLFGVYAMGDGCNDATSTYACTAYAISRGEMPWFRQVGSYSGCSSFIGPTTNCPN